MLYTIFAIGVISGGIGGFVGGASLFSIPFLIFAGLPPDIAIATNRFSSTGMNISIIARYLRSDKIQWRYIPVLLLASVMGGLAGAVLVSILDAPALKRIIGVITLVLVPVLACMPPKKIRPSWNLDNKPVKLTGYIAYFLVMTFVGFFGGGGMLLLTATTIHLFGVDALQSNATNNVLILPANIAALCIFFWQGIINIPAGLALLVGMMIGAYFGTGLALQVGAKTVKIALAVTSLLSAVLLLIK